MDSKHNIFPAERMVMYTDAIFAIALTLLILEIKIPEISPDKEGSLLSLLLMNWPSYLSFLISFLIISVIWFNHHTMFHYIRSVDHNLMLINTLLILNVVAIPFCSALLGRYSEAGDHNSVTAAVVYGGWITLGGIPFNWIWRYVLKHEHLLKEGYQRSDLLVIKKHFQRGPIFYLICTLLALISSWASICGFALLIILYFFPASYWLKNKKSEMNK